MSLTRLLNDLQLAAVESAFQHGADDASSAMAKWLNQPALINVESVEQMPLNEATEVLGESNAQLCFCTMKISGALAGFVILAFDEACGLALSDMIQENPQGTTTGWGELAESAALETTNIIGCAYLNSLTRHLPGADTLLPTPPTFRRDFAASLLQFALMQQLVAEDVVLLARTKFEVGGSPLNWTLLIIPDAQSIAFLRDVIPGEKQTQ